MKSVDEIYKVLEERLTPRRLKHSVGVAQTSQRLAELYGYDTHKAYVAGLVHDYAKDLKYDEMICQAKTLGVFLDDMTLKSVALIHGPVGAEMAKRDFTITDEEMVSSIHFHTTAKADMTLLEKIIYLSDFIEPNRNYPGVNKLRELALIDLDEALLLALSNTINYVVSIGAPIHVRTIEARNFIILKRMEQNGSM